METSNALYDILANNCGPVSLSKGHFDGKEALKVRVPKPYHFDHCDALVIIDGAQIKVVDKTLDAILNEEVVIQLADPEMINKLLSTVNPILNRTRALLGYNIEEKVPKWSTITQKN